MNSVPRKIISEGDPTREMNYHWQGMVVRMHLADHNLGYTPWEFEYYDDPTQLKCVMTIKRKDIKWDIEERYNYYILYEDICVYTTLGFSMPNMFAVILGIDASLLT